LSKNPLGRATETASKYSPDLLFAVPRSDARLATGIGTGLPFSGVDVWNAWELTWLDSTGKPVVATAQFRIPFNSPNIIESKSLKLYLNSLAMTRYPDSKQVSEIIQKDLSATAGSPVAVNFFSTNAWPEQQIANLPGTCIDSGPASLNTTETDASLLNCLEEHVELEELHSHLLRSLCPVTNQPDMGSILLRYSGPKIDPSGLLGYLVSYREHHDFHEACVERIFVDIKKRCCPERLTVFAFFNRRGGLDINPFRSDFETEPGDFRLWRQ